VVVGGSGGVRTLHIQARPRTRLPARCLHYYPHVFADAGVACAALRAITHTRRPPKMALRHPLVCARWSTPRSGLVLFGCARGQASHPTAVRRRFWHTQNMSRRSGKAKPQRRVPMFVMSATQRGMMVTRCSERAHAARIHRCRPCHATTDVGHLASGQCLRRRRLRHWTGPCGPVLANFLRELLQGSSDVAVP
jgi:hypothetical protein